MPLKIRNPSNDWSTAKNIRLWNGSSWTSAKTGRIWNGTQWVIFFDATNPIFLPPSINVNLFDQVEDGQPFYGSVTIELKNNGTLIVGTETSQGVGAGQSYTWLNGGSASSYEAFMANPVNPPYNSNAWYTGQSLTDIWIGLESTLTWSYSVSVDATRPNPNPILPDFPTPAETFILNSQLTIRSQVNNGISVTCPINISITLGV